MKIQFKHKEYQEDAVNDVVDCFAGQPKTEGITEETILKHRVFFVSDNTLAACFDVGLDEAFVKELAKRQPLRAVFRDSSYASDSVKINFEQIFKALSPHTELKTL